MKHYIMLTFWFCLVGCSALFSSNHSIHPISLSVKPIGNDVTIQIPAEFALSQHYTSHNSTITISYSLSEKPGLMLMITTKMGKSVRMLVSETIEVGYNDIVCEGMDDYERCVARCALYREEGF